MNEHKHTLDVEAVRRDFPILSRTVGDHPLVYLDSAATSQKPNQVIDAEADFYRHHYANAHRGIHMLGEEATEAYEGARATVARFLGAPSPETIVFTRGVTESLNLVAQGWGRKFLGDGDEILHHRDGASLQHRAVADDRGGHGRDAAVHPAHRRRPARPVRARVPAHRANEDRQRHRHVERAGHDHAPAPARRCRARRGCRDRGRRRPARAAPVDRRAGSRRRPPVLHRPQDARPHGQRRPLRHGRDLWRRWTPCSAAAR